MEDEPVVQGLSSFACTAVIQVESYLIDTV